MRQNIQIFFIWQISILLRHFVVLGDTFTFSDFNVVNILEVVNYQTSVIDTTSTKNTYTFPYQTQFKNPQIIMCIHQMDIDTRPNWVAFSVKGQIDTSAKNIIITAQQYNDSVINNFRITYMIVEHQSVFITQENYAIPSANTNLVISITKSYQKASSQPPQVYIYLTGYKSQLQGNTNKIYVSITNQSSSGFSIQITRSDVGIQQVFYNYIEIYNDSSIQFPPFASGASLSPYYGEEGGLEQTYIDSTSSPLNDDVSSIPNGLQRYSNQITIPIEISTPISQTFNHTQAGIMLGFTGFEINIQDRTQGLRLTIDTPTFSNSQFNYKYRTWNTARIQGLVSQYLYFNMIMCNQYATSPINDSINYKCQNQCNPIGQYQNSDSSRNIQICSSCNTQCLSCNGPNNNQCLSCIKGQYLNPSNNQCTTCNTQCSECSNNISCTKCSTSFPYYYNSQCYANQPPNTYCDKITQICTQCPLTCSTCTVDMKCIICKNATDYFLNGSCNSSQPPNSYCNQQFQCTSCPAECSGCNLALLCLQCKDQSYFYFQGKCSTSQPSSTYCSVNSSLNINLYCQLCHPACKSCSGGAFNQCITCSDGYTMINTTVCVCSQNGYAYNPANQQCDVCSIPGCTKCSLDINKCQQCDNNLTLDTIAQQCYCSQPTMFYDKLIHKTCMQNTIKYCNQSDRFSNTCTQCNAGFLNVQNQICSFCGKGLYTNQLNQCVNKCQDECLICTTNQTCLLKEQQNSGGNNNGGIDIDYSKYNCHYSCSMCNGESASNCLTCSSSTRVYSIQEQSCLCQNEFFDAGKKDCQQYIDLSESFYNIENVLFYISFIGQLPFVLLSRNDLVNYNYIIVQMITVLSLDSELQQNLNYSKVLSLFQKYSLVNLFNFQFIQNEIPMIKLEINSLIIIAALQLCALLIYALNLILKRPSFQSFGGQLVALVNRFTSTIQLVFISNLFFNLDSLESTVQLAISIIGVSIQLLNTTLNIFLLFKLTPNKNSEINGSSDLDSSSSAQSFLSSTSTNDKSGQQAEDQQSLQQKTRNQSKVLLNFEIGRVLIAVLLAFQQRNQISIYICAGILFFQVVVLVMMQPFGVKEKILQAIALQLIVTVIFIIHAVVRKGVLIQMQEEESSNNVTQYLIEFLIILVYLIQIIVTISIVGLAMSLIYSKLQNQSSRKKSNYPSLINSKIPSSISKDQIDKILNPQWSYNPYSRQSQNYNNFPFSSKR